MVRHRAEGGVGHLLGTVGFHVHIVEPKYTEPSELHGILEPIASHGRRRQSGNEGAGLTRFAARAEGER